MTLSEKEYYSTREVANLLGYSAEYVRSLCKQGKIKSTKIGFVIAISKEDLKDFLQSRQNKGLG
jgi:excisionase family DNA binding protein